MSTVLIARFKNKKEAEEAAGLLKEKASVHVSENLEDLVLGQLVEDGMKEPGSVPASIVKKELLKMMHGSVHK